MKRFSLRRRYLMAAALLSLLLLASVLAVNRVNATQPPPSIPGMSTVNMADAGMSFAAPSSTPAIDERTALQSLPYRGPDVNVLQVVLADVTDSGRTPTIYCLCYVVSITPQDAPAVGDTSHPVAPPTYTIELVDATSGAYLGMVGN